MTTTAVVEQGVLTVKAGSEEEFETALRGAVPLIARQPGFLSIRVARGIERPGAYLLLVEWETLEAHTEGFRKSADYGPWREALHRFYDPMPTIEHFTELDLR